MNNYEYTLSSENPERYSYIDAYFPHTPYDKNQLIVTGLTTTANIRILKKSDYITIDGSKIYMNDDYSNLRHDEFAATLNQLLPNGLLITLDNCNRFVFTSPNLFTIGETSYNLRVVLGLHPFDTLELIPAWVNAVYVYVIPTVGFMLSTPILYLVSNVGQQTFRYSRSSRNIQSTAIVMRINNSFSPNFPITALNGEFVTNILGSNISNLWFQLVDANLIELDLLSPLYISISIRPIISEHQPNVILPDVINPTVLVGGVPRYVLESLLTTNSVELLGNPEYISSLNPEHFKEFVVEQPKETEEQKQNP